MTMRWLKKLWWLALIMPALLRAHPAAQGRIDFDVTAQSSAQSGTPTATATITVSAEEVFVGTTLGKLPTEPKTLHETWAAYGEYLVRHVRVTLDGRVLPGHLLHVTAPENTPPTPVAMAQERAVYQMQYLLNVEAASARSITLEQDCLTEIDYAVGNAWTASYVVRVARDGHTVRDGLLLDSRRPLVVELSEGAAISQGAIWREYFRHGVWHILTGYDHLLFVTALALATVTLWDLVKVVSAFTVAHTITLVLSVLNIVRLPASIVEPMIAGSIVFVALQNALFPRTSRGWTRLAVAFGFGLFHGLGFAGGLLDAMSELPRTAMLSALSAFSLGVEAGHQMVVLPVFFALALCFKKSGESWRTPVLRCGSTAIALAGLFYLLTALTA